MFLDYYACSKLDVEGAAKFVEGVANGCRQSACALVGGETAEMPGIYQSGEYDAGGAAIGAIKQGATILPDTASMTEGDVLIGMASSGVHSNGFSLVRRIVETQGISYSDACPWSSGENLGTALLTPTKIYVSRSASAPTLPSSRISSARPGCRARRKELAAFGRVQMAQERGPFGEFGACEDFQHRSWYGTCCQPGERQDDHGPTTGVWREGLRGG